MLGDGKVKNNNYEILLRNGYRIPVYIEGDYKSILCQIAASTSTKLVFDSDSGSVMVATEDISSICPLGVIPAINVPAGRSPLTAHPGLHYSCMP
jgi:hypothetical protein